MIFMAEHPIQGMMDSAMGNLKSMVDVNTIIGEPVNAPDGTVIIPVSTVGFGFGVGGSEFGAKKGSQTEGGNMFGGGCGGGVSIKPTAFLVVGNGTVRLLPIGGGNSPVDKIIDLVPEMVNKVNNAFADMSQKRKEKKEEAKAESNKEEDAQVVNIVDIDV